MQEDESTPERLDDMPDAGTAEAKRDSSRAGEEPTTTDMDPVSAAAPGDLRQQLEARRRARAGM